MEFQEFFRTACGRKHDPGFAPYEYQLRLAQHAWPDFLDIPTGLGKTAGLILSWLYKRFTGDADTPRRLVYCLPMRVLVEQTHRNADAWVDALAPLFAEQGERPPLVYTLLGGEFDTEWVRQPEREAILIGTQDMLLSRALMRGYGISRYQWPVDFALLHNDTLWVYDEVQLMGPALATSAQLEAFRRDPNHPPAKASRSIWASATLRPEWLATVDFRQWQASAHTLRLSDEERCTPPVTRRIAATKHLECADTALNETTRKAKNKAYIEGLAEEIVRAHQTGEQTLVILNRVDRAQKLFQQIGKTTDTPLLLLHARFRPHERRELDHQLQQPCGLQGRIIIATQAVEAGVDITSRVLFTELAPWSSLIQRFGRCNRAGEYDWSDIRWIDIADKADEAAPYEQDDLQMARQQLQQLSSASPRDLPAVTDAPPVGQVIRCRDFLSLFNTDADLSGFDVDISPYIRDTGTAQLQLFWRDFEDEPGEQTAPQRAELCPASISQVRDFIRKRGPTWRWDALASEWVRLGNDNPRPGMMLLLRAGDGGYDETLGFHPTARSPVVVLTGQNQEPAAYPDDSLTLTGWLPLKDHLHDAAKHADALCTALEETAEPITAAARWHDVGKAHAAFQNALANVELPPEPNTLWAKSSGRGRLVYGLYEDEQYKQRPYFRHELASALAWLEHNAVHPDRDLIAYLIAAHHGKVRMGLRALPDEAEPDDPQRLFARGIWDGEELPPLQFDGLELPATPLHLGIMRLGDGSQGPSWTARTSDLLDELGPFRLAWLESLVRIADWRASAQRDGQ